MHRNIVALIWLAGIAVAAIAYMADPGALLDAALGLLAVAMASIERLVRNLSAFGTAVMRALALGLFVTFVALSILAIRQGRRARMALVTVSVLFLLLVRDGAEASRGRWTAAFALAAVAALVMTGRVRRLPA